MLVLTRKQNESIIINDNIIITVVEVGQGRIRLGISAPREVPVMREEIYRATHGGDSPVGTATEG